MAQALQWGTVVQVASGHELVIETAGVRFKVRLAQIQSAPNHTQMGRRAKRALGELALNRRVAFSSGEQMLTKDTTLDLLLSGVSLSRLMLETGLVTAECEQRYKTATNHWQWTCLGD